MKRARNDLFVHGHARLAQASSVVQALLIEQVQRPDTDPRRRQARQILPDEPARPLGIRSVEVPPPGQLIVAFGPHEALGAVAVGAGAVVEHRVDQHLERELDVVAIVGPLSHRGREMSTGTGPADRDAVRVDPRLVGQPQQRRIAVLDRDRIGVLGRQPVFHRGHRDAGEMRQLASGTCRPGRRVP